MLAVTTLGAPWWIDRIVMRRPVKRVLKRAILGVCAPQAAFGMLSLCKTEQLSAEEVERFSGKVERALAQWR